MSNQHPQQQLPPQQQKPTILDAQAQASLHKKKTPAQELANGIRTLQSAIIKDDTSAVEVREAVKIISRLLDQEVERTRKRPEARSDLDWLEKKQKLQESKRGLQEIWKIKTNPKQ
jgi:hypothetical protein